MSSGTSKVTAKMKSQDGDVRTLKPILPKLSPVVTRVIEINAPTMQMCKCFVCDERVISSGVPLLQSTTQVSNTDLPTKIGQLMGEKFMVVVSADDVICRKCHALVNHVDKLESDLLLVKRSLRNHLKKKYGLNDDTKETDLLKNNNEVEMEYALIQDVESEEDQEPRAKRLKPTRPARFRAIKPKPPGSVQLLMCQSCNFITTEPNLLSCHRLVCTAMAYKCTMCDKKFDSQKMIRNHKIEAHLTKWICHFCNISFNEEKKFTVHMKNHLGDRLNNKTMNPKTDEMKKEKTVLSFKCPHCPESFEAFSQLQIHLVNHTSSVTFKCVRCDVGFENKQELIEHVKSHDEPVPEEYILPGSPKEIKETSETLFSCPVCSLNFLQEDFYLQHLSMHQELESEEQQEQQQQQDGLGMFVVEESKNGMKTDELECLNCGEKKEDAETLEMHRLTECLGGDKKVANEVKQVSESEFQENAGEEASQLELNPLLYVNSLNVELVDGNVALDDATGDDVEHETDANSKSVEDILENMFQVKDEDKREGEEGPDSEQRSNLVKQGKTKMFACSECSFTTHGVAALKRHFAEKVHETVTCPTCKKPVDSKQLQKHVETEHGAAILSQKTLETFKCWICKKSFQMEELRKHVAAEHGTTPVVLPHKTYSCVHCSEKFSNRRALHLHEVTHPENLNISCPDCGEKFARDKFLNEHRETNHVVSHCRICSKAFGNVKQVKSHEARHAKSDKTEFKCLECGRIFQTPTGLRHHKAIHTGEFKYKCEFCDKGFVARVRYEEHRASHTKEERYSCEICGKKFSFQATYWIHRKWHDNPTPYKCEYCGRLFKHSSLLSVHKRKHTGERPYECPHCDQSFAVGNTLKRHLMLHTGVFPFTCQICDQGFSGKHKIALHMSKVHQDNTLLEQQNQKKPSEYKMVVKDEKPEEANTNLENQTWILTENDSSGSQMLTIQTQKGENIPCTLLTDDMIGSLVNSNNRIVEIIPYDSVKTENAADENSEVGFILMNPADRSSLGIGSDDEDFVEQTYNGVDDGKTVTATQVAVLANSEESNSENRCDGVDENITEFVSGL